MWDSRTILATAEGGRLAGSIHLVTPEPHPRWMPSAGFLFDAEGTRPAGLLVSLVPDDREHVFVILRMPDTMESMPIARFPVDRWVPISAWIDERVSSVSPSVASTPSIGCPPASRAGRC